MADVDRRDFVAVFSAMAALAATGLEAAQQAPQGRLTTAQLSKSGVVRFADLPVVKLENGGAQRRVMSGTLPTGEFIEIHETVLPAGEDWASGRSRIGTIIAGSPAALITSIVIRSVIAIGA